MVTRESLQHEIAGALTRSRIVMLLGPRQCGKTTLAREFVSSDSVNYFDLEDPVSIERLREPMTALKHLTSTIVIDEVQRMPELFPVLRVLADRVPLPSKFLILGSASPDLLKHSSETLAGRTETIEMAGFSLTETGSEHHSQHWLRGGFPLSFLASTDNNSAIWRRNYTRMVVERDIPLSGHAIPATTMTRFLTMLAHYHGQLWNAADISKSLGIGESSVRRYCDILSDLFMIRQLPPWHANIKKRQVKSPKIYFRDSGILHQFLGIRTHRDLMTNPKCGASWEGYIIEELIRMCKPDEAYFWATHNKAELDLLMIIEGRTVGIECKRADAPAITPSMRAALDDLQLSHLFVIYPGEISYDLSETIHVVPFGTMTPALFAR